jgi:HEAT repeat protein
MDNGKNGFDEQKVITLIKNILIEEDKYKQEKLAEKIGSIKDEKTAELVADLLYSEDAYIRNTAIELFIALGVNSLQVLNEKLSDTNRNIRKFALDALKYIKGKRSCEIAMAALDDPDENVVEAALEVIAEQSYKEAAGKLVNIFDDTNSIWIINALIRTFDKLGLKELSVVISEKIFSINASAIERNILMNTYVRALGSIGSYGDIDLILYKYSKDFIIEDSNLVFGLCSLIVNNKITSLSENTVLELERIFKESWDYKDISLLFVSISAFVQIGIDFFLPNIKEIYYSHRGEEFFIEDLHNVLQKFDSIPDSFINELLSSEEPELSMLGLKLKDKKNIANLNSMEYREEAEANFVEKKDSIETSDIDLLLSKLEHQNPRVRKLAAQKLVELSEPKNVELLEEIVMRNQEVEGLEAIEVLFRLNSDIGLKHISSRMDSKNANIRAGLIDIMEYSSDCNFYEFMNTMINDPSQKVRRKTIKALSRRNNDESLRLLLKLYKNEYDAVNRMDIVSNAYKFSNDTAFKLLCDAADSNDILTRIAAARSLGKCDNVMAGDVLQRMLSDPIEEVREAAKEALSGVEVME